MKKFKLIFFVFFIFGIHAYAQKININGFVFNDSQEALADVKIMIGESLFFTNNKGYYEGSFELKKSIEIVFIKTGYQNYSKEINPNGETEISLNVLLIKEKPLESLDTITITKKKKSNKPAQSIEISAAIINKLPTLSGGIEDILKTLPGVNSNSELSSKFSVRGGSLDENLVYIDDLEIIFPNLVRNGQQEGLSLINPSMTDNIYFSAGGFESAYGDKMSSVLAVNYRKPKKNQIILEASLLGANVTGDYLSKNKKLSFVGGVRYLDRTLVLNTFSEDTEFNPKFIDAQTKLNYAFNPKWDLSYMGRFSNNIIAIDPQSKQVNFGTLDKPVQLNLFYEGKERDKYKTFYNALTLSHKPNNKLKIDFSLFNTHMEETEAFDIQSFYVFNKDNPSSGGLNFDVGSQIDHARNDLITNVYGVQQNIEYLFGNKNRLQAGIKFQKEELQDRLNEWQLLIANGYSYPSSYDDFPPQIPDNSDLTLRYAVNSKAKLSSNRFSGFTQYGKQWNLSNGILFFTGGIRGTYWDFNKELNLSPRTQIAYRPKSDKNIEFRLAGGAYYQPPFYREMRDLQGNLNQNIKSQQSLHIIFGNDYTFNLKKKKVNLTTELYYKKLNNLIPYFLDNVRVRYTALNNSEGQAYGIDTRLSTEITEGLESWLSLSYARTTENIDGRGVIPRPTDQRFRGSVFFQDYMPAFPSFKMVLNLVYASGLPNGAPLFTDPYLFQGNLPDYKRVDVSLIKVFKDKNIANKGTFFNQFSEFTVGLEIFNVFDIKNTISNQSIVDISSNIQYFVPYTLTGRFFNLKVLIKSK